jgi:Zn-dependent alcohol dehydrogenase
MQIGAAVTRALELPFEIVECDIAEPGPREVLALAVRGVVEGDAVPGVFIPQLIDLFRQGLLPVDKLVSFFFHLTRSIARSKRWRPARSSSPFC